MRPGGQAMRRAALLLALSLIVPCADAQELGRLFFTPEQRAALDARRRARVPDKPAAAPAVLSPTTRLDGFVRRSGGPPTVWVNGVPTEDSAPGSDARVAVPVGESGARVRLKPGQTLDRGTGEVRDVMGPGGELQVHRKR